MSANVRRLTPTLAVPRRLCAIHRPVSRVVKVVTKRDSGLPWVALE